MCRFPEVELRNPEISRLPSRFCNSNKFRSIRRRYRPSTESLSSPCLATVTASLNLLPYPSMRVVDSPLNALSYPFMQRE